VSHLLLHELGVDTIFDLMCHVRMAQAMRSQHLVKTKRCAVLGEPLLDVPCRDSPSPLGQPHGIAARKSVPGPDIDQVIVDNINDPGHDGVNGATPRRRALRSLAPSDCQLAILAQFRGFGIAIPVGDIEPGGLVAPQSFSGGLRPVA
jgi:hypothetical protein